MIKGKVFGLSIILLLSVCLNAKNVGIEDGYFGAGGEKTKELKELLEKDEFFKLGNNALINGKKVDIEKKDVETKMPTKYKFNLPDWNTAYLNFKKSADKYKNPVSAYACVYAINTIYGKKDLLVDYKKYSEILYESSKDMCDSYLNYAAIFQDGILGKKDNKKAEEILKEGLKSACSKGWKRQVVESKIWSLKREK